MVKRIKLYYLPVNKTFELEQVLLKDLESLDRFIISTENLTVFYVATQYKDVTKFFMMNTELTEPCSDLMSMYCGNYVWKISNV